MQYIIVNYHYIRPDTRQFKACLEQTFVKQLDYLRANYEMVPIPEAYRAAHEQREGKYCALTFDDGLKEHYAFAFPLLQRYSIPATFFLIGRALQGGFVSLSHKLHVLLSHSSARELRDKFHDFFSGKYHIDDTVPLNPKRRFDDMLTANLKETIIALPSSEKESFIEELFRRSYNETELASSMFLSAREAKRMSENGMEIGAHGYTHTALDTLDRESQRQEIEAVTHTIEEATGAAPTMFSYPNGRYNEHTALLLRSLGFAYATTIEKGDLSAARDTLLLPSYDTNHIIV